MKQFDNEAINYLSKFSVTLDQHVDRLFNTEKGNDAEYCYLKACEFIRSVETHNENNKANDLVNGYIDIDDYYTDYVEDFDYVSVAKVLSCADNRIPSYWSYVVGNGLSYKDRTTTPNERAYKWLMVNAVFENFSMFILETFNAKLKEDNDNLVWEGFENWIKSKQITLKNGKRAFKFFDDTEAPLIVV